MTNHWSPWDGEPVGDDPDGKRRRWRRPWHHYACIILGFIGMVMVIGAATNRSVPGTLGGLCVLAAVYALSRADGIRPTTARPAPPLPTAREERTWYAASGVLLVLGVVLTTF